MFFIVKKCIPYLYLFFDCPDDWHRRSCPDFLFSLSRNAFEPTFLLKNRPWGILLLETFCKKNLALMTHITTEAEESLSSLGSRRIWASKIFICLVARRSAILASTQFSSTVRNQISNSIFNLLIGFILII